MVLEESQVGFVIASEAKQSSAAPPFWIASFASLLAMTDKTAED